MKIRVVLDILGLMLVLLGSLMLIPGIVAAIYKEPAGVMALGLSSFITISVGLILRRIGTNGEVTHREAFVIVAFAWLLATIFGALPFSFLGLDKIDSLFETMSGFTTTGATILTESDLHGYWIINSTVADNSIAHNMVNALFNSIEGSSESIGKISTPDSSIYNYAEHTFYGLLFWRAFTQLLGGMSIILLFIAILPHLGVAGRQLYYVDTSREALTPRVRSTAKIFWGIYLSFVAAQTILLWTAGISLYDSLCTSFATISTAGFSPLSAGIVAYDNVLIEAILVIFMIVGATSFILHYQIIYKRDLFSYFKDPEFRLYILLQASAIALVVIWGGVDGDILHRIRLVGFHIVSVATTTGFTNTFDYAHWSHMANMVIIMLMLTGGCAGATAGGIKVLRELLIGKYTRRELMKMLHPKAVIPVKLNNLSVSEEVLISVLFFTIMYLIIFFACSLALLIVESGNQDFNLLSAISAVATCMASVGPGLGVVALDFSQVTPMGKMIAIFCMYIGRMEILPVMLLFLPDLWKD